MQPNKHFVGKSSEFWANVQFISERSGYSIRATKKKPELLMKRYDINDILYSFGKIGKGRKHKMKEEGEWQKDLGKLSVSHLLEGNVDPTTLCLSILDYLNYRAEVIERYVSNLLMNREEASAYFMHLKKELKPTCHLPKNKQSGVKSHHLYLTGIVNMLTEVTLEGEKFDDNPNGLTLITKDNMPVKVLSRRMDGAFPSKIDPLAIWEVKEYYGTTTFGSRVADGVYETLLDGYEINEVDELIDGLAQQNKDISEAYVNGERIRHYLIVDDYFTWYVKGRSYLCRIVDMLHKGFIDEVIFGREVLTRWPQIVENWR